MSKQHPFILYTGDARSGAALLTAAEARGWWVYLSQESSEALGMYMAYAPDAVIIDAEHDELTAAEIYHHLRSVDAQPLLILNSDMPWDVSADEDQSVYMLSPHTGVDDLLDFVATVLVEEVFIPAL